MFVKNKYYRWYYQIINRARSRGKPNGYYEKHHVLPKCMGGSNDFWNIVNLSFREHFLVHWLLIKCTSTEVNSRLLMAFSLMRKTDACGKRTLSPWQYEKVRKSRLGMAYSAEIRIKMSENSIGRRVSEAAKLKSSLKSKGIPKSEETKRKMSEAQKGHIVTDAARHKISLANKGRRLSEEHKLKISNSWKGKNHTAEAKAKISAATKGHVVDYKTRLKYSRLYKGVPLSEERKAKLRGRECPEKNKILFSSLYKGKPRSEEVKQNIRAGIVLREQRRRERKTSMPTFVIRDGKLVEKSHVSNTDAPNVISDIMPPTRHMANGLTYESKSLFRQATRDAGCVEIGNENVIQQPRKPVELDRRQRREDIRRAINDLKDGRAPTIRHILDMQKE